MSERRNTVIESLGVYLPSRVVTTEEIVRGCKRKILLPLEHITGIKSRRVAADDEFAVDMAAKAIANCLDISKYHPKDMDLLISCSISRYNATSSFSFEPSTSVKLRKQFGFDNALTLDVSNACAGFFTAIYIVDCFIKTGLIERGMVASGEYLTHLINTAQQELRGFTDPRLACLTVGDSGAAVILEAGPDDVAGFHEIDVYTLGSYHSLCIAKATDKDHGGCIMLTDALKLSGAAIREATAHAIEVQRKAGWPSELMDHLIMHQTSDRTISEAVQLVNKLYGQKICHEGNVIRNLTHRGNTATTSHIVALGDHIRSGRIRSGDSALFSVNGSGLTIGTAAYKFDDLPDRLRGAVPRNGDGPRPVESEVLSDHAPSARTQQFPQVRIEAVGAIPDWWPVRRETLELARVAAENCLEESVYDRSEIDLLIYAGVYRSEYLSEPAIAAAVAGELRMNDTRESPSQKRTLAFDVMNGGLGFLNACQVAIQMIQTGRFRRAMIVTSEVENNSRLAGRPLVGLHETGTAVVLDNRTGGRVGFGEFLFRAYPEHLSDVESYADVSVPGAFLVYKRDPAAEEHYISCGAETVRELLRELNLNASDVGVVLSPQISSSFTDELSRRTGLRRETFVDVAAGAEKGGDFFTSSLPSAFRYARERGLAHVGDIGLIISIGSGIQVGCALYYF